MLSIVLSSGCGNPAFPQLTGTVDLPLPLELLPMEGLSRETWLRKPPRSEKGLRADAP